MIFVVLWSQCSLAMSTNCAYYYFILTFYFGFIPNLFLLFLDVLQVFSCGGRTLSFVSRKFTLKSAPAVMQRTCSLLELSRTYRHSPLQNIRTAVPSVRLVHVEANCEDCSIMTLTLSTFFTEVLNLAETPDRKLFEYDSFFPFCFSFSSHHNTRACLLQHRCTQRNLQSVQVPEKVQN